MATPAVTLRPLGAGDVDALLDLRLRNRAFLEPWEPVRDRDFYTRPVHEEEVRAGIEAAAADRGYAYGIFAPQLVGRIALNAIVRGVFGNAYVGYFVDEAQNGRGIATAAVRLALAEAFGPLDLHRVQAAVMPRNTGSIRAVRKAGLREEGYAERYLRINGVWEDHILFAITGEEHTA